MSGDLIFQKDAGGGTTYSKSISYYNAVLSDVRYTPKQPIIKTVEIPGRSAPLDISRAATGTMGYTAALYEFDVSFVGSAALVTNAYNATDLMGFVNGQYCTVTYKSGNTSIGVINGEVSVTKYEYVGAYVLLTIRVDVM